MKTRGFTLAWRLAAVIAIWIVTTILFPTLSRAEESADSTTTNAPPLHTRTFKLDGDAFYINLQAFGSRFPNVSTNVGTVETAEDGKYRRLQYLIGGFNAEKEFRLLVASFLNENGVNLAPPKGLAVDNHQAAFTVRATDKDLELVEQVVKKLNVAPPEVTVKVRFAELNDEDMFKPGFEWFLNTIKNNGSNNVPSIAGILTEPRFNTLWKYFAQTNNGNLLFEAESTTLSGRQVSFEPDETNGAPNTNSGPAISTYYDETNSPYTLDIVPYVEKDGCTIQMTIIPTATEFLKYDAPSNVVTTATSSSEIPRTRIHQVVMDCTVWDGQTAVFLLKPPFVPQNKSNIAVFVTPVIIDAAGNPKNSAETMPFSQNSIPPLPH